MDLHQVEEVRDKLVNNEGMTKGRLKAILGDDSEAVASFVNRVHSLSEQRAMTVAERERNEQDQLTEACTDLQRLERKLDGMRKRLHHAFLGSDTGHGQTRHRKQGRPK